ncbi:MAG: hypothetical protein A4E62_03140 [Syntrophorhabdus sp. PtaU1.Bin002]|nr:MAG: hypothetical protein A4E62_03140 [Syntrophorhabdus sp. PtaU1.Bin002]
MREAKSVQIGIGDQFVEARAEDQNLGFKVVNSVSKAFRLEIRVQGNGNCPGFHDCVIADHIFDAVLHKERNAVAFLDTVREEMAGKIVGPGVYLGVGDSSFTVDNSNLIRIKPSASF